MRLVLLSLCHIAFMTPVLALEPGVTIAYDFVEAFDEAVQRSVSQASASQREKVGGEVLPGVFIHPGPDGDAVVAYDGVLVPGVGGFLLFHVGIRDGFEWNSPRTPDGVQFSVAVEGETVFSEVVADTGWRMRSVSLAPWEGKTVSIELRTNGRDNTNYDWAVFGRPAAIQLRDAPLDALDPHCSGLALVAIDVIEPAEVVLRAGGHATRATLPDGQHWLPVAFDTPAPAELEVITGQAGVDELRYAPFWPQIEVLRFEVSTPYVEVGKLFNVIVQVANLGWGAVVEDQQQLFMNFEASESPGGPTQGTLAMPRPVPPLSAGERGWMMWDEVEVQAPGYAKVYLDDGQALHFRVHPPAAPFPEVPSGAPGVTVIDEGRGMVETPLGRLLVDVRDDGHAWLEVRSIAGFERVGMLYPLAQLTVAGGSPYDAVDFNKLEVDGAALRLTSDGGVTLSLAPEGESGRIASEVAYTAATDTAVSALYGPRVLAGQGAFGAHKDFAIFPGLEYLARNEGSSSERDLVYPLSERQVPARYKIATPLMAVEANHALIGIQWNMHQAWAAGEAYPAARFHAPSPEQGFTQVTMALFAPSVGDYVEENSYEASRPFLLEAGATARVGYSLILDHASNYAPDSIVHGDLDGGLVLQTFRHYFDAFGMPQPSEVPRDWEAEKQLSLDGYFNAVWQEDPPGWSHCHNWPAGLLVGHALPQMLVKRAGVAVEVAEEVERRVNAVLGRAIEEQGPRILWSGAGCHIVFGELPFYYGYVPEALEGMTTHARGLIEKREAGLWVWRPQREKYAELGIPGDHTLGQAARPAYTLLRAARLSGDRDLAATGLEAMQQMTRYDVPRGAQMWECPLYQPDILAAAYAIRAYCEAYRLTGDPAHLDRARYWAWTGLPFLYLWEMPGYPTMRYNVISVIGSTFYSHSWIGLPVVWCGLVYAYALQDFAEFDDSLDWRAIARGINTSAQWQQYTEGPNRGTYPDSWHMVENEPRPADINPENILMNGFRLHGPSPAIDFERFHTTAGVVMLNSAARITRAEGSPGERTVKLSLEGPAGFPVYSLLAPVAAPTAVKGAGEPAVSSAALREMTAGWLYAPALGGVVIKSDMAGGKARIQLDWE